MTDKVFTPIQVGKMTLDHRFAMAPMTRSRATFDGVQTPLAADYYGQRAADMGLLITEGVYPSLQGQGNHETPGLATAEHVAAWQPVTKAVRDNGGYIFVQLQHAGVMTHPENAPERPVAIAPSAVAPGVDIYTPNGAREIPVPNEATVEDLATAVAQFRQAARNAIDAGADGVEIQGANGFLLHQFFGIESNLRQDNYGGSLENRIRFTLEVVAAVADEIGAEKTALRLSPLNPTVPVSEGDDALALYELLLDKLSDLDLAFVELRVPDVATLAALRALHGRFGGQCAGT